MNDAGYTAYWLIVGDGYTGSLATWYSEKYGIDYGGAQAVWASSAPLMLQDSFKEITLKGI